LRIVVPELFDSSSKLPTPGQYSVVVPLTVFFTRLPS
jgi:hypothetical protein